MKRFFGLRALFIVYAIVAAIGGLAEALAPHQSVGSFVSSLDADVALMARMTGVFQAGTAIIAFMVRDIRDAAALRAILVGFTFMNVGVVLVATQQMVSMGAISTHGIGDLIIHGLLAVWFGYFLVANLGRRQPREAFSPE